MAVLLTMPIISFACAETESLFFGSRVRRFIKFEAVAMRKQADVEIVDYH